MLTGKGDYFVGGDFYMMSSNEDFVVVAILLDFILVVIPSC